MNTTPPLLAVTMGDPAGVGPEVIVRAFADDALRTTTRAVVFGDRRVLNHASVATQAVVPWHEFANAEASAQPHALPDGCVGLVNLENVDPAHWAWGRLSGAHGQAALDYLEAAMSAVDSGYLAGIVTAPLNKEATSLAGCADLGHMELLARRYQVHDHATMLVSGRLRCVHVSTHYSLRVALDRITRARVLQRLITTDAAFRRWSAGGAEHPRDGQKRRAPKIAVASVNPHNGEGGLLGREEIEELAPAVAEARALGIEAFGPFAADSVFVRAMRGEFDAVVAMFHDQGHIPVKVHGFEESVSVALGLPIVRTSVDHGTAFDIAGKGLADARSMAESIRVARDICAGTWLAE